VVRDCLENSRSARSLRVVSGFQRERPTPARRTVVCVPRILAIRLFTRGRFHDAENSMVGRGLVGGGPGVQSG